MREHDISEHELTLAIILDTKELADHTLHDALSKDLRVLVSENSCLRKTHIISILPRISNVIKPEKMHSNYEQ